MKNKIKKSKEVSNNYSNSYIKTNNRKLELSIPRDKQSTFEPKTIKKYQIDISQMENKIF